MERLSESLIPLSNSQISIPGSLFNVLLPQKATNKTNAHCGHAQYIMYALLTQINSRVYDSEPKIFSQSELHFVVVFHRKKQSSLLIL